MSEEEKKKRRKSKKVEWKRWLCDWLVFNAVSAVSAVYNYCCIWDQYYDWATQEVQYLLSSKGRDEDCLKIKHQKAV